MSGESLRAPVQRAQSTDAVDADGQRVMDALGDPDCRRVIGAVAETALTANECASVCDIPLSTVYRKLELLETAGLVDETLRVRRDGKHANEYRLRFDSVRVGVGEDGSLVLSVSRDEADRSPLDP
jgi:DNA-binding transcriptional ArsR family regulator